MQDDGQHLLLALHHLCLDPAVASALLPQLHTARELLARAWAEASPAAAEEEEEQGEGSSSWASVRDSLAEALAVLGPSSHASLHALCCPGGAGGAVTELSQRAALALLRRLVGVEKVCAGRQEAGTWDSLVETNSTGVVNQGCCIRMHSFPCFGLVWTAVYFDMCRRCLRGGAVQYWAS